MPNQQLLDYIKQQIQLGVPTEAIKNALLNSGWPAGEVEEALKPAAGASPVSQPAVSPASPVAAAPAAASPKMDSVTKVSPSAAPASSPLSASTGSKTDFFQPREAVFQPTAVAGAASGGAGMGEGIKKHLLTIILGVVVILLLAATAYLYARNSSLSKQLGVPSVLPIGGGDELSQQVAALNTEKTNLQGQLSALTADNANLKMLLNFFAVPAASAPSSTVKGLSVSVAGKLSETKTGFALTTTENVVLSVKNYKDTKVSAALKKVLDMASVTLSGTYDIGTPSISVERINNQTPDEILNPPAAATSTPAAATSTPPATTTPPAAPASTSTSTSTP